MGVDPFAEIKENSEVDKDGFKQLINIGGVQIVCFKEKPTLCAFFAFTEFTIEDWNDFVDDVCVEFSSELNKSLKDYISGGSVDSKRYIVYKADANFRDIEDPEKIIKSGEYLEQGREVEIIAHLSEGEKPKALVRYKGEITRYCTSTTNLMAIESVNDTTTYKLKTEQKPLSLPYSKSENENVTTELALKIILKCGEYTHIQKVEGDKLTDMGWVKTSDLKKMYLTANYKKIDEEMFGSLKENEETEIVLDEDNYQNSDGDFITQMDLGTNCFATCTTYTGTNPQYKNYLFNKVYYASINDKIVFTKNDEVIEKEVLAKKATGQNNTLTETYEVVSFENTRLFDAINEINNRLEAETPEPSIVGVSYGAKEGPYNSTGYTTDHYIVIVAKGRDVKGIYFRYLDPGTSKGAREERKLYINDDLVISDEFREGNAYYVVELRLENNKLPSCQTEPTVDPLILKMRVEYIKNHPND